MIRSFLFIAIFLTFFVSNAQRNAALTRNAIIGTWSLVRVSASNDTLFLKKIPRAVKLNGSEVAFSANGLLTKALKPIQAESQSDPAWKNPTGNWEIDASGTILSCTIAVLNDRKSFKILALSRNTMTLLVP